MSGQGAVFVFTFWAMFFTAWSALKLFWRDEDPAVTRLNRLSAPNAHARQETKRTLAAHTRMDSTTVKQTREKLIMAGLKRKSDLEKFLLLRKICFVMPFFVSIFMFFLVRASMQEVVLSGVFSSVFFIMIPTYWMVRATNKHRKEIRKFLPDTLDLFIVALEAGLSFDSALVRVGEEQRRVSTHISREFLFTNQQILVGKSRDEALNNLAKRCGVDEMNSLVRAVIQSNKLGSSLVKTLKGHAETLRKKRRQEIQAQILKAPVKLVFPLLLFIFPTLLVVILGPSLVQIFRQLNVSGL